MTTTTATIAVRNAIATALAAVPGVDWPDAAVAVLDAMGYRSELVLEDQTGDPANFIRQFDADNPGTQTERRFLEDARSVQLVFQITNAEIAEAAAPSQQMRFDAGGFDSGNAQSFLFLAMELAGDDYSRGRYAEFTREINKRLFAPSVILFRTASNRVTFAFPHRRPNRRDPERDVLGRVSLIREIDPARPHRAHLDILAELSLPERLRWMEAHGKPHNFDGLLDAWLNALDTEELNRRFYRDLFKWFERAVKIAKFPTNEARTLSSEEHVIRLITRLMFVWFIKEKRLLADDLFVENQAAQLLKDYDRDTGDSYYRAVLQNLFFATLNTEIGQRGFSSENNDTHRDFSRYRYRREIADPDTLVALLGKTPFINGGLFDCLDSFDATGKGGYRIDCFSDNRTQSRLLSIPNRLFFSAAPQGNDPGLIDLFHRYKFTVEENTPAEQEVALDPELLGKVFENLLAAYNPETRENARKQTGSYYTPRPVVDYMVDETLVATLAQKAAPDGDSDSWKPRLRHLIDYGFDYEVADAEDLFAQEERESVVRAIARIKTLDPAVGSGAFPMGILHKLTLALRRLDPDNELWERVQRDEAASRSANAYRSLGDDEQRLEALAEIENTFRRYRATDYGRKLYLIQNSIYGVDIQPVATQIAKLRFFISLAIEQQPGDDPADNYGIRPLPNLETRFVAADTLLSIGSLNRELTSEWTRELQRQLNVNRERHFHATSRSQKFQYRDTDKQLRQQLADSLTDSGLDAGHAVRVAQWDPYDQNASAAEWFDPEYMFGVTDGFDVVLGNPPYVRADSGEAHTALRRAIENSNQYETLWEKWDMYVPFIEKSYKLLAENGFTALIVSDAYCHAKYAQKSREWFLKNSRIIHLDFLSDIQIFEASVKNVSYLIQKGDGSNNEPERRVHNREIGQFVLLSSDQQNKLTERAFFPDDSGGRIFSAQTVPLSEVCYVSVGMVVHADEKTSQGTFGLKDLVSDQQDDIHPRPFVEGKHIDKWLPVTTKWLEWGTERAPALFRRQTFPELYGAEEKILVQRSPGPDPKACYDAEKITFDASSVGFTLWKDLAGVRNRSIKKQARYRGEKPPRPDLPRREELEETSKGFGIKFLLGVMNSNAAIYFLKANRRSNIHLYPDDWKKLPIPKISAAKQRPLVQLVERILKAKAANPAADTTAEEAEIDRLVYALYGLTEDEVTAVERGLGLIHQTDEEEDAALLKAMLEVSIDDPDDFASEAEVMATLRSLRDPHGN